MGLKVMAKNARCIRRLRHRQNGLSLIELMVALVVAMIITLGLAVMFSTSSTNFRELSGTSQQLENGRYALQIIREDLELAGFYGGYDGVLDRAVVASLPDPCADINNITELRDGLVVPVQGYDDDTGYGDLGCINNHLAGTDVVVIRRASTSATIDGLSANTAYIQQGMGRGVTELATGQDGSFTQRREDNSFYPIYPYFVRIYYIRNDAVPTLVRTQLGSNGLMVTEPLAEGIEDIRVLYGVEVPDPAPPHGASDVSGTPTEYLAADALDTAEWGNVVTAQVSLLARNIRPSQGYVDQRSYTLGDKNIPSIGDNFKRQVFSGVVRIQNVSQRREW